MNNNVFFQSLARIMPAEGYFFEVIEKYQPEYIIVWGKRLWNNLPGADWRHENASGNTKIFGK